MPAISKAIIVGGGIGGLSVAHALQRIGVSTRVLEIGDPKDRLGTGITLLGNSLRALAGLGLVDDCLEGGQGWDSVSMRDGAGNILSQQVSPRVWRADRPGALGIMRPRLGQILEEHATRSGARIDFRTSVTSVEQDSDGVNVQLSNGEFDRADLLVVADGVYSKTRDLVFGSEFRPRYVGQGVWRYTVPRPEKVDGFVLYGLQNGASIGALPLSNELCYLFFLETTKEKLRIPEDQVCDYVRDLMEPFTAPELIEARNHISPERHISYRPFDALLMPGPWFKGRVVLLGDAAHSLTPQMTSGGGMAIEDALVLGEEIERASEVSDALAKYTSRREPRVKRVFDIGYALSMEEQTHARGREYTMQLLHEGHSFLATPV